MFHPNDNPMERGWVGRVDGERVLHLAAQTLQAFFLGGGGAREHAEYPLADVTLLAPVLQPPNVRVFEAQEEFGFANTTAVTGPGVLVDAAGSRLSLLPRLAAVIGADGRIGGTTLLAEWRAGDRAVPKDRDFALVLGPVVVTPDELDPGAVELVVAVEGEERLRAPAPSFDWEAARRHAGAHTTLRPGDVLAGPPAGRLEGVAGRVDLRGTGIGLLAQSAG
jgi:hypothetical protein